MEKKGKVFLSEVMHKVEKKLAYCQNKISKRIIIITQMKKMKQNITTISGTNGNGS
jgi:hypothetical protein